MALIIGIIVFAAVLALEMVGPRYNPAFLRGIFKREHPFGSKLMVAFIAGFMFFTLFTGRMPSEWQKIPVAIVCLLLIWANLFLGKKDVEQ
jgi:hypothetical protein